MPTGVYMKMMNFRRFDLAFQVAGRTGLSQGNRIEEEVWAEFAENREALGQAAHSIRMALRDDAVTFSSIDDNREVEQGGSILRLHLENAAGN